MTLADAAENIGRSVKYLSRPKAVAEYGKIKRVSDEFVFVVYTHNRTAQGTRAAFLSFTYERCPFCGKFDKLVFDAEVVAIVCATIAGGCGAMGPFATARQINPDAVDFWEKKADDLWNRRKT